MEVEGKQADVASAVVHDTTQPAGAERPGQIEIVYLDGASSTVLHLQYAGGHAVSRRAPAELKAGV